MAKKKKQRQDRRATFIALELGEIEASKAYFPVKNCKKKKKKSSDCRGCMLYKP